LHVSMHEDNLVAKCLSDFLNNLHAFAAAVAYSSLPSPATCCRYNQQDFGWWRIITVAGGFTSHSPDPAQLQLCVALNSHLPVPLPIVGASLVLTDSQGSWTLPLGIGAGPDLLQQQQQQQQRGKQAAAADDIMHGLQDLQLTSMQDAAGSGSWPLALQPGSWQLLHVRFPPRCVGTVAAEQLQLQLSEHCTVNFAIGSFPPGRPALGSSSMPAGGESPFRVRQGVKLGFWVGKVQHVGCLPELQVRRLWMCYATSVTDVLLLGGGVADQSEDGSESGTRVVHGQGAADRLPNNGAGEAVMVVLCYKCY
jgi:hypothetical protein